jgi:hypothetical protein
MSGVGSSPAMPAVLQEVDVILQELKDLGACRAAPPCPLPRPLPFFPILSDSFDRFLVINDQLDHNLFALSLHITPDATPRSWACLSYPRLP